MVRKPKIQYVGQFYVYGSEAKQLELKEKVKEEKIQLPLPKFETVHKLQIEPVAVVSILLSMVLLFSMVLGTIQIQNAWAEYGVMESYVAGLEKTNAQLNHSYHTKFDLEEVKAAAISLGMVPVSELQTLSVSVTVPEAVEEPSFLEAAWEDFLWLVDGLL